MSRMKRIVLLVVALGLFVLQVSTAAALAPTKRHRDVPLVGPLSGTAAPIRFRDRVLTSSRAVASRARARAVGQRYYTPDGYSVEVEVSPSYVPDAESDQSFVDFLASRLHDFELGELKMYIAPAAEIGAICGADSAACYITTEDRMYIPGEDSPDVPLEYVMTHEYGHHVASWRRNTPWPALDWGPKYWSSFNYVCDNTAAGKFFPGDEGEHYLDNPGEGFAEAYAQYHYEGAFWSFNPLMIPIDGDFRAVERDVKSPWVASKQRTLRGRLGTRRRSRTFLVRMHLDGQTSVRLSGPRGTNFNIELLWRGTSLKRSRQGGSRDRLSYLYCRDTAQTEVAKVRVVRKRGVGKFRVALSYAG